MNAPLQQTEFLPIYVVRKFVKSTVVVVVVEIGKSDP
jgi:hypothetical protein